MNILERITKLWDILVNSGKLLIKYNALKAKYDAEVAPIMNLLGGADAETLINQVDADIRAILADEPPPA